MLKNEFIKKSKLVHGEKYDYTSVLYVNNRTKVTILCKEHGEFTQTPYKHINMGQNCPKCMGFKKTNDDIINQFNLTHGDKYDYTSVNYEKSNKKITITCKEHGEFTQTPKDHLRGNGCPKCSGRNVSNVEIINELKSFHNNRYKYNFINKKKKITITCEEHGEFYQSYNTHKKGHGCPKCSFEKNRLIRTKSLNQFVDDANSVHGDRYDYSLVDYIRSRDKINIICKEHGTFNQTGESHLRGYGCPSCGDKYQKEIKNIFNLLNDNKIEFEINNNTILNGKELDIYIKNKNLAIEYDGLYWHCDKFKDKKYHLEKTIECEKKGVRLIHIFEDELVHNPSIVLSKILNIAGVCSNRIFARKCEIRKVSNFDSRKFLNENHLQGYSVCSIRLGLFYKNELVSLMTFCRPKRKNSLTNEFELNRFSNKKDTIVVGGASKLLSYFTKNNKNSTIYSFADRRWSNGGLYEKLGFQIKRINPPDYWYCKSNKRIHKSHFRKNKLRKRFSIETDFTEWGIVENLGYNRIWDCGKITYVFNS